MNKHPYEFYAYKNIEMDKCPECNSLPRDYHVPNTHIAIISRVTFSCARGHEWLAPVVLSQYEESYHHYGECPICGESCQPDFPNDDWTEEMVQCDECKITWTLHHDDPTDKHDDTEPWRTYRISNVEAS